LKTQQILQTKKVRVKQREPFGEYLTANLLLPILESNITMELPKFNEAGDLPNGASIFWIRPNALIGGETVEEFIAYWRIKRDKTTRGILEIEASE